MADTLGLLFKIRADSDQARAEMNKLRNAFDTDVKAIEKGGANAFLKLGESAGLSTSQMASLSKALPLVAVGITAVAAAATAAAVGLFALVKSASDYGSAIFDASQKTGVSTETLSALKFAADQSGSSMEELTAGIRIFSKTVGDAAKGSDEAKDKLKRLGIDPQEALKDLESALAKAFKTINEAPEGILQTNAALDAFGRSGANLIPTVQSFDGNLEVLISRAKDLGVTFDEESARMADAFGDAYDTIVAQAKGIGFSIAGELMPQITQAMTDISRYVSENKETFRAWGEGVANTISGLRAIADSEFGRMIGTIIRLTAHLDVIGRAFRQFGAMSGPTPATPLDTSRPAYNQAPLLGAKDFGPTGSPYDIKPRGTGGGRGGGGAKKETDEDRALKFLKQYQEQLANLTPRTEAQKAAEKLRTEGLNNATAATKALVEAAAADIDAKKKQKEATEQLEKAQKLFKDFYIKQLQDLRAAQGIPGPNASDELDELTDRMSLLGQKMEPGLLALMQLRALAISGAEAIKQLKDNIDLVGLSGGLPGGGTGVMGPIDAGTPPPGGGVDWEALTSTIADTLGTSTGVIREFGNMATTTFSNIAQGVGQAYEAFILFGSGGEGIKKFAARMIASLAAMAATNAAFEVAMGLSKLALNYFFPSPNLAKAASTHFAAAAAFGLVAGVAGIAGRAIAGNSFAAGGAGGGTGAGAQGGQPGQGGTTAARETNVIDLERNRPAPIDVNVRVDLHTNDAHIIDSVVSNVNNDGRLRKMIVGMVEG